MGNDVETVVKRLLRRALSTIYLSVGFFLILAWAWRNYLGIVITAIAYIATASIVYSHVFRPLFRLRDVCSLLRHEPARVVKVLGAAASCLGLVALVLSILSALAKVPRNVVPLAGSVATVLAVGSLSYLVARSRLASVVDAIAVANLALAIITYFAAPGLALPLAGTVFLALGIYGYASYYLATHGASK